MIKKLQAYVKIGDPIDPTTTVGPLAMKKQVFTIHKQVSQSVKKGAKILYGDLNYQMKTKDLAQGFYFHPLVLANIKKG